MDNNISISHQAIAARVFNILLLILTTLTAFGVIVLNFSRENYVEISNQIFTPDKPLMDSVMLDYLLHKGTSVIILLFMALVAIKEIKVVSIKRRLRLNLAAFASITAYAALILYLIYSPIMNAG